MCIFAVYTYSCGHPCFEQRQWARCPHLTYKERQLPELITPCPDLRRTSWRVFRWCTKCTIAARREGKHVPEPAKGKLRRKVAEKIREEYWDGQWVEVKLDGSSEDNEPMERELMLATLHQEYIPREETPPAKPKATPKWYGKMSIDELRERFRISPASDHERRVRILSPETGEISSPGLDLSDPSFLDSGLGSDMVELPIKALSESEESEEL